MRIWFGIGGLIVGCLVGSVISILLLDARAHERTAGVTCRPSAPALAMRDVSKPVVLFWGNSLLHDHHWDDPAYAAVNCARQGMTAQDALERVPMLPDGIRFDTIHLAFGSVEAARGNAEGYDAAVREMISALRVRYPGARILVASIPSDTTRQWSYRMDPDAMNASLREVAGEQLLDLDKAIARAVVEPATYDGVHLTVDSYAAWQSALKERLSRR